MNLEEDPRAKLEELQRQWDAQSDDVLGDEAKAVGDITPEAIAAALEKKHANDMRMGGVSRAPTDDSSPPAELKPMVADVKAAAPAPPEEPWARMKYDLEQNATRKPAPDPIAAKMEAVGWTKPPETPPDWAKIQRDIQNAESSAELRRGIQQGYQAVSNGRFHADPNVGSEDIAAAKAPLEVAQARQNFEQSAAHARAEDIASKQKLLEQAKEMARRNPDSAESQTARASLQPIFERVGALPAGFDKWTAEDVDAHAKLLTPIAGQLTQERIAKGHEEAAAAEKKAAADLKKAEADKKESEEKTAVDALRGAMKSNPRLAELGFKPDALDGMDRKGLEEIDRNLRDLPNKKPGAGGPVVHVKAGDYSTVPEDIRDTVRAIAEYRAKAPEAGSRFGARVLSYVNRIDPTFDASKFDAYRQLREHLARDPEVVAANTALEHLRHAKGNIPDNFDSPTLNRIRNAVLTGAGSDKLTPFETDVKVAADEIARAYGNNTEAGKLAQEHLFEGVQSKAQLLRRFEEQESLLGTRLHSKEQQFAAAAPKGASIDLGGTKPEQPKAQLQTRPLKGGKGTAYSKDGKNWYPTPEEATAARD